MALSDIVSVSPQHCDQDGARTPIKVPGLKSTPGCGKAQSMSSGQPKYHEHGFALPIHLSAS